MLSYCDYHAFCIVVAIIVRVVCVQNLQCAVTAVKGALLDNGYKHVEYSVAHLNKKFRSWHIVSGKHFKA